MRSGAPSSALSGYASQYLRITAPTNAALAALQAAPSYTLAVLQPLASRVATQTGAADEALLRSTWPTGVRAAIDAQVRADGPIIRDLEDLAHASESAVVRDAEAASGAANVVRADLGLPAIALAG